jgi:hypothetical protein
LLLLLTAWCVRLSAALPAATPLIAAASSIVPVIAIALLSSSATTTTAFTAFVALLLTALTALPTLGAASRLRIVLLRLRGSAGVARSVGRGVGDRG